MRSVCRSVCLVVVVCVCSVVDTGLRDSPLVKGIPPKFLLGHIVSGCVQAMPFHRGPQKNLTSNPDRRAPHLVRNLIVPFLLVGADLLHSEEILVYPWISSVL